MITDAARLRLLLFAGFILLIAGGAALGALYLLRVRRQRSQPRPAFRRMAVGFLLAFAAGGLCAAWALFVEPDWLTVTHERLQTDRLPRGTRVRVVHLSDLHVSGPTRALAQLPARVAALKPDVVVYTGDSLNARHGAPIFREVVSSLPATHGRFAVRGNHDVWYWDDVDLFGGGVATELASTEPIQVTDTRVHLCGAAYGDEEQLRACVRATPQDAFLLVAYHTPDLVESLPPGVDLYLAGHTHGGQVRLPLYGALITMSRFDKRYEMGRYQVNGTTLYVNRGIGSEGDGLSRARFLAPPEITVIDLEGTR